jgi:hypothetical protein
MYYLLKNILSKYNAYTQKTGGNWTMQDISYELVKVPIIYKFHFDITYIEKLCGSLCSLVSF